MNALQNSLATSSGPYQGLSSLRLQMAITYVLQQLAKDTHTPNQLAALATCFGCPSDHDIQIIKTYLLWQIAGGASAPVVDPDVAAFILCSGITDPTQIGAVTTLVASLKSASLWNSFDAIYPLVGGNAVAHSCNLKNPAKFSIVWRGGVTHSANGATGDGVNALGDTGMNPVSAGGNYTTNSASFGYYSKTAALSVGATPMGSTDNLNNDAFIEAGGVNQLDGFINANSNAGTEQVVPNFLGNTAIVRTDTLHHVVYGPGGTTTVNEAVVAMPNATFYLLATNLGGIGITNAAMTMAFAFIAGGFTGGQIATLNPIIVTYETTLGRA